jgi:hypothetical protein
MCRFLAGLQEPAMRDVSKILPIAYGKAQWFFIV